MLALRPGSECWEELQPFPVCTPNRLRPHRSGTAWWPGAGDSGPVVGHVLPGRPAPHQAAQSAALGRAQPRAVLPVLRGDDAAKCFVNYRGDPVVGRPHVQLSSSQPGDVGPATHSEKSDS